MVPRQALLYFTIGAKLALWRAGSKPNLDDQSAVVSPAQEAPNGIDIAFALFFASSLHCIFAAIFAILLKQCLANYLVHKGESLIERCRDRQRKFDALEEWRFDLFLKIPRVLLLIALPLLICGLCQLILCLDLPAPYVPFPLSVLVASTSLGILGAVKFF